MRVIPALTMQDEASKMHPKSNKKIGGIRPGYTLHGPRSGFKSQHPLLANSLPIFFSTESTQFQVLSFPPESKLRGQQRGSTVKPGPSRALEMAGLTGHLAAMGRPRHTTPSTACTTALHFGSWYISWVLGIVSHQERGALSACKLLRWCTMSFCHCTPARYICLGRLARGSWEHRPAGF
jgi:hypothetical protein